MNKEVKRAYVYEVKCVKCEKNQPVYFTVPDFGDAPIIQKCRFCDTLYWHTPEDEYHIKPLDKQLEGKVCIKCNADLSKALVPAHSHIKCCNMEFSLDDNFSYNIDWDCASMAEVEVSLIY